MEKLPGIEGQQTEQEEVSVKVPATDETEKRDADVNDSENDKEKSLLVVNQNVDVDMMVTKDQIEAAPVTTANMATVVIAEVGNEEIDKDVEHKCRAECNALYEKVAENDEEIKTDDETAQEGKSENDFATAKDSVEQMVSIGALSVDTLSAVDADKSTQNGAMKQEVSGSSSPKRKHWAQALTSETKIGEPVAKKQRMDEDGVNASENINVDDSTPTPNEHNGALPSLVISRDDMAKMEEDSGRLKFVVITNDGLDEHMIQLTTLKNIFAKQLPKMPKEYIVRLVFDKNHRSMLILKNGTHVIGGICYRPFEKNGFAEIAFCAINASDQVKGYGTRLMNHLKEYVKTKNITHFLTYADNYAIGYFKKQGFTKSVSMARPNWYGYIKDYDGGTLMECTIHTRIDYLRITSMIHMQRKVRENSIFTYFHEQKELRFYVQAIQVKIQERSRSRTVYPGLTKFAEGRLMDIYMVPGVKEAGWSQAVIRNSRIGLSDVIYACTCSTRDQGSLKSQLSQLLKAVSNHRSAWPFHEPVDTSVVVDYLDHIKEPVDLQLISKRIDSGAYISKAAFRLDLEKMCENCTIYNTPDTNYYKAALDLRAFIQSRIPIRDPK
ncbi:hypothetical protein PsorP6_004676 [Peronosclerospora sorghi]|uniref:Uncharacterized protein n=1 Tax=Peronosclerospora sorghi TaxID=230839 RepID=A0ACC0VQZ5_9STRA|nr:hypothetical protein PsorP6_004676 [Peronosclerospora sorghi]